MQIQVIVEARANKAEDSFGSVMAGLKRTEHGYPLIHADAYAVEGLLGILDVRAARGERELMVLQCGREQIQAVLEWQSETEDLLNLKDLVIHLVRKAEI
ncbi:hypothetical protein [Pseudomonas coronafaciens]|uniref:Uncharacterized protein n=1 Tax=Pseudomonas coronafaciens pv. coronafaciens TaxID=235275 RepID=A0AAE6UP41_9PSED|nr:hypothetical protein [Pseudomonas coronafaciens]QGT84252.1 hypothetical protein GMO17_25415 [Pseudomonas coronafaciens pv. coronafaciens]QIQ72136.1 hypothetical protein HBB04_02529 [Pseudomonas coronafaciens]RMM78313.1 hypothetical protein ALQ71_00552 [Pseudomonas coronafaciens pv. striafaciens]